MSLRDQYRKEPKDNPDLAAREPTAAATALGELPPPTPQRDKDLAGRGADSEPLIVREGAADGPQDCPVDYAGGDMRVGAERRNRGTLHFDGRRLKACTGQVQRSLAAKPGRPGNRSGAGHPTRRQTPSPSATGAEHRNV